MDALYTVGGKLFKLQATQDASELGWEGEQVKGNHHNPHQKPY